MGLFKSATCPKSRFSIVSKAWGTVPAGSDSAAIVFAVPCLVCEMCEKSTKRELVGDKKAAFDCSGGKSLINLSRMLSLPVRPMSQHLLALFSRS
jgi:hypothetical protein